MNKKPEIFTDLKQLATKLRSTLEDKKYILLFAHNGIGKTRLSMAFKDAGKAGKRRDTLYFNAYTEDLFTWDNDIDSDDQRALGINKESRFFAGLQELEMESRIRGLLERYGDFDFTIDYEKWSIIFSREDTNHIKISRGEENIFIWCFFLAVAQLVIDRQEAYREVKYLYIDDPISSLDDNNVIAVACHLAQLLKNKSNKNVNDKEVDDEVKVVISSHHALFFNVMWNELKPRRKANQTLSYFLNSDNISGKYSLRDTGDTPSFHHIALLRQLNEAAESGKIYTYHFNILRNILEKTATFHGFNRFADCIQKTPDDPENIVHVRMINVLSHGNYSLFDPIEMVDDNKEHFKKILRNFIRDYKFNPELVSQSTEQEH